MLSRVPGVTDAPRVVFSHASFEPTTMPPRPRPRPANRPVNEHVQHAVSSVTPAVSLAKTDRESELDRGDELFMRNRNRTAKDWKKLDELAKGEFFTTCLSHAQ